jgi:hypothetical protein
MTERDEFEAWYPTVLMPNLNREESGEYCSPQTWAAFKAWQACAAIKDRRIAELEAELALRRKSGSATDRLHNICEGISRDADGSEWSREEWERIDAENASLRKQVAELTAMLPQMDMEHGTLVMGIVHRSPLIEFGTRNRELAKLQAKKEIDELTAERDALRKVVEYVLQDEPSGLPRVSSATRKAIDAAVKGTT